MARIKKETYQIDRISKKYLPLLLIFQSYVPIIMRFEIGKTHIIFSYLIYGLLSIYSFLYFYVHRNEIIPKYPYISALYALLIVYVAASCVKLYYVPSSIFFYQRLVCFTSFLSFGAIFLLMQEGVVKRTFRMWWRYVPWVSLAFFWMIDASIAMSIMFFSFFFMMMADCLRKQLRWLTYAFVAIFAMYGIVQRMDYIIILAPIGINLLLRFNLFLTYRKSVFVYNVLMLMPIIFLLLATIGNFNVLNFDSYIKGEYVSASGEDMTADTRTFIYQEAFTSAEKNNYILLGRTPGYGYDSKFVKDRKGSFLEVEGIIPQRYSEVFIVNIFTWCGVLGVIVWFIFFYIFGINTLKRSKNKYIRAFVIYVGIFWVCCWINFPFERPSATYILIYIIMSICIRPQFQQMTDVEIRDYFKRMLH